jgi:plasmid maintenance system antidote protein VapI
MVRARATATGPAPWDPDWCIRPGLTLAEELDELGLSRSTVAHLTGLAVDEIEAVMAGAPITEAVALALARMPASPSAGFWRALEANYRAALAAGKPDISDG